MKSNSPVIELPPKYYLTYFGYMLDFVQKMYFAILSEKEREFLDAFERLSEDAQCLFVRFSNRRRSFFRLHLLDYKEINDLPEALNELLDLGFIEALSDAHSPRTDEVIDLFTKPDLLALVALLKPEVMPVKSIKKPDLVRWLRYEYSSFDLFNAISDTEPVVRVGYEVEVMMMKFLFFGNRYDDMTEFVVRDLGHVRFQSFEEEKLTQKFATRKDAEDTLMVSLTSELFAVLKDSIPSDEVFDWFMNWQGGIAGGLSPVASPSYIRLILKVGGWLERVKLPAQALTVYQATEQAPSRERRVRLLQRMGAMEEAVALCQEIVSDPQNADERFFGLDFLAKLSGGKKKNVRSTTHALNTAESIDIAVDFRHRVEIGALAYYRDHGYEAFFSENEPWRAIFGLVFWDIIYDTNVQAIHHPLQRVPSDFFLPDFYVKRRAMLLERLAHLDDRQKMKLAIEATYTAKFGVSNVLVNWYDQLLASVLVIIELVPSDHIRAVLLEMASNLRENIRGFPDLFIWKDDEYYFIEIKSPTDHLSSQQLHWQHFFKDRGIHSKIVRVKWMEAL